MKTPNAFDSTSIRLSVKIENWGVVYKIHLEKSLHGGVDVRHRDFFDFTPDFVLSTEI